MTVPEIKKAVKQLDGKQLAEFRDWFWEHDADAWDRQIKEDAEAGRLDPLAEQAREEYRAGRTLPMPGDDVDEADVA